MRRFAVHALIYGLVLLATTTIVGLDGSFGSDDGAYGGQVHALRNGSWALARPLPVVPAANEGWFNNAITPDGPTPYTANPAYSRLLDLVAGMVHGRPSTPAGGATAGQLALGLHLPGLVAALVSAAVAWRLAGRWDRRAAPVAFWLLGLGPILVNTTALWAHPLSTASAGAALLAVVELDAAPIPRWHRWGWWLLLAAALAAGAALRTEASLYTLALVASVVIARRPRRVVMPVAVAAAAALVVAVANRSWGQALRADRVPLETGVEALEGPGSWLATRIPAAWQLLVTQPGTAVATMLAVGALLLAAHGALCLRRPHTTHLAAASFGIAAGLLLLRVAVAPGEVITGLLAAWPLVAVALLLGNGPTGDHAPTRDQGTPVPMAAAPDTPTTGGAAVVAGAGWLLLPCGLLLAAVVATQYANSGGLQWGGRYLSMIYVPLAVVAAVRLVPRLAPLPVATMAAVALAVIPAVAGVAASRFLHHTHATVVAQVTDPPAEVVITELPALPRIAWTALPVAVYRADHTTIADLLGRLADAGVATVNVQGSTEVDLDGTAGYRVSADRNGIRHLVRSVPGPPAQAEPPTGPGPVTPSPAVPGGGP